MKNRKILLTIISTALIVSAAFLCGINAGAQETVSVEEEEIKPVPSKLSAKIKLRDTSIVAGKSTSISGAVKSNYQLMQITVSIVGTKYKKTVKPSGMSYSLLSGFKKAMAFHKLKGGKTYTVRLTVRDVSGKTVTKSVKLAVKRSALRIRLEAKKVKMEEGTKNAISGAVNSNKKIIKVTVKLIKRRNKKTYYRKTVKPGRSAYKLSEEINRGIFFECLTPGAYVCKVTAWDKTGNKISKSIDIAVKEKRYSAIKYPLKNGVTFQGRNKAKYGEACCLASVATCELYYEKQGRGKFGNLLLRSKDPLASMYRRNGNSVLVNWQVVGYKSKPYRGLKSMYAALKKGPLLVYKTSYHWSVVYAYTGNKKRLETKGFKVFEVFDGSRVSLSYWLRSSGSINGAGALVNYAYKSM